MWIWDIITFGSVPNLMSGIIITADGAANFRENGVKNMTEVDGVKSGGCVTFKTKAPSNFY